MLTYHDVEKLLPEPEGIKGVPITFESITWQSSVEQHKGLFVVIATDDDLQKAIANGAVAVIWPKGKDIPSYTPNHFPVFLAEDPSEALIQLIKKNKAKISLHKSGDQTEMKINEVHPENELLKQIQLLFHKEDQFIAEEGENEQ